MTEHVTEHVTDDTRFDTEKVFTPDHYYYFFPEDLLPEHIEKEVSVIWRALDLLTGMEVLDLACGNGRIANALAARGCLVTGLDITGSDWEGQPFSLQSLRMVIVAEK